MKKSIVGGILFVVAVFFAIHSIQTWLVGGRPNSANLAPGQVPVTLVKTVDGDTIKVEMNGKVKTVRYLLIDTPESKKPGMCVQPFAKEASARNNELVSSGSLTLEYEEKNLTDKYGRLLAYVFADGKSVQETLLKEGYARVAYIYYPPYKYLSIYRADAKAAQDAKLKIWSKPGYVSYKGFIGCVGGEHKYGKRKTAYRSGN